MLLQLLSQVALAYPFPSGWKDCFPQRIVEYVEKEKGNQTLEPIFMILGEVEKPIDYEGFSNVVYEANITNEIFVKRRPFYISQPNGLDEIVDLIKYGMSKSESDNATIIIVGHAGKEIGIRNAYFGRGIGEGEIIANYNTAKIILNTCGPSKRAVEELTSFFLRLFKVVRLYHAESYEKISYAKILDPFLNSKDDVMFYEKKPCGDFIALMFGNETERKMFEIIPKDSVFVVKKREENK